MRMESGVQKEPMTVHGLDSTAAQLNTKGHRWCISPYPSKVLPCFLAHEQDTHAHQHVCFKIPDKPMEVAAAAGVNTKSHDSTIYCSLI